MSEMNKLLIQNQILMGEKLYAEAIHLVLANAVHEINIFDQDLSRGDFANLQKYELLKDFLSNNVTSKLTIILQDTLYFQEKCPRLFGLLAIYGHKMAVLETNETAKHAKDCFILADNKHYIKRIHIDQARFKYVLNDESSVEQLTTRFEELLETTHHRVPVTTLGL